MCMLAVLTVIILSLLYLSFIIFRFIAGRLPLGIVGEDHINVPKRKKLGFFEIFISPKMTVLNVFVFKMALEQAYLNGPLGALLFCVCEPLSYLLVYVFMFSKLFKSVRGSIYEWICYFYGNSIMAIFAFCELVSNVLFISVNMKVIAELLYALGVNFSFICFFAFIFMIFSVLESFNNSKDGNILAISLFKFVLFLFIPVVCFLSVFNFADMTFQYVFGGSDRMRLSSYFSSFPSAFVSIAMIVRFGFPFVDSTLYSNTVVNASRKSIFSFLSSVLFVLVYSAIFVIVGFCLFTLEPALSQGDILGYFLGFISHPFLRGVFISILLYSAFTLSANTLKAMYDIATNNLFGVFSFSASNYKLIRSVIVFVIPLVAYLFSMLNIDSVELFFFSSWSNFSMSLIPLTLTVLGFRTHKNCIYISIVAGFVGTFLFAVLTLGTEYCKFSFLPGMVFNALFLILSHLYYVYFKDFKFDKIEIEEVSRLENNMLFDEKVASLLNKSRANLVLKMKSVFFNEPGFNKLSDVDILKNFIKNDIIKACVEYRVYRFCIYRFILKKNVDFFDVLYDDDEFAVAVDKDILNIKLKKP